MFIHILTFRVELVPKKKMNELFGSQLDHYSLNLHKADFTIKNSLY